MELTSLRLRFWTSAATRGLGKPLLGFRGLGFGVLGFGGIKVLGFSSFFELLFLRCPGIREAYTARTIWLMWPHTSGNSGFFCGSCLIAKLFPLVSLTPTCRAHDICLHCEPSNLPSSPSASHHLPPPTSARTREASSFTLKHDLPD